MKVETGTILQSAATALQDECEPRRWPLPELLGYLNDGLREMVRIAPLAFLEYRVHELREGTQQYVPDCYQVLTVSTNVSGGSYDEAGEPDGPIQRGRALRQVNLDRLSAFDLYWHGKEEQAEAKEYLIPGSDRRMFWVFPPNDGTGKVELQLIAYPKTVDAPAEPDNIDSYTMAAGVESVYAPALDYYIQSRAWAKDADFAANHELATRYYELFKEVLQRENVLTGETLR